MKVRRLWPVDDEVIEAVQYYRAIDPKLSDRLIAELEATVLRLVHFPESGRPLANDLRQCALNPNNPLGGTSCLHDAWQAICVHFARPFVVHSYGYERLSASQTESQLASPCIHALMDCLG